MFKKIFQKINEKGLYQFNAIVILNLKVFV